MFNFRAGLLPSYNRRFWGLVVEVFSYFTGYIKQWMAGQWGRSVHPRSGTQLLP